MFPQSNKIQAVLQKTTHLTPVTSPQSPPSTKFTSIDHIAHTFGRSARSEQFDRQSRMTTRSVRSDEMSDSSEETEMDFLKGPKWDCFCPSTFKRQNAFYRHVLKKHPDFSSKNPSFGKRNMFVRIDQATGFPIKKLCLSPDQATKRNQAQRNRCKEEEKKKIIQRQMIPVFESQISTISQSLEKKAFAWSAKIVELIKIVDEKKLEILHFMNFIKSMVGEREKYGEKWDHKMQEIASSCGSVLPYVDIVLTNMMMLNQKIEQLGISVETEEVEIIL